MNFPYSSVNDARSDWVVAAEIFWACAGSGESRDDPFGLKEVERLGEPESEMLFRV